MSVYIRMDEVLDIMRTNWADYDGDTAMQLSIDNVRELQGIEIEDAAKHEPKLETATIGGWDPVKRFDEIFRKKEGE